MNMKQGSSLTVIALLLAGATAARAETPVAAAAVPADAAPAAAPAADIDTGAAIVVTAKSTRSATALPGTEIQKILPGVSPLKAIQTLPGVLYITADPWGYNEQNAQIFIHGFASNQLGYTMDGLPLGDQSYGNYNGLAPQRAVISENVGRVVVATGAGDLATASNSNLGGTVETYSSSPLRTLGAQVSQTFGSYSTSRTFARIDTGAFGPSGENSAYISAARQHARAWDFNGIQGGYQVNAKFVHDDSIGKLTVFFDWNDMTQPNEDATVFFKPSAGGTATAAQLYTPYSKPFYYPDFSSYRTSYLSALGNTPSTVGSNYRNYYSDAQRTDYLGYIRYDAHLSSKITWSNTAYYHHNDGAGVVGGPLGQSVTTAQAYLDPAYASLPTNCRFGGNGNGVLPSACTALTAAQAAAAGAALVKATGGSGLITRTTEYRIDRGGLISALNIDLGAHKIELGGWFERNSTTQWRRWYGVDVNNPNSSTPYIRPLDVEPPLFTQYQGEARINELQLHLQDTWQMFDKLLVQAGFKTSGQWADGWFPIQPKLGSLSGLAGGLPQGKIDTLRWFLPAVGATYDFNGHEQAYFNVQKNLRQYSAYLAGGGGPWFTGSQAAFDAFAQQGKPETSWTYEGGFRTNRNFANDIGLQAQINYYHVVFNNRLLAISTNPGGIAGSGITGGTSILVNVGDVHTDGVDAAFTVRLGRIFSLYNAVSYNLSKYRSDYTSAATGIGAATGTCIGGFVVTNGVVPTCGKQLPGTPKWMNKTVATLDFGPFEAQVIGDFVGKRFATFADDASVPSYFLTSLRIAAKVPENILPLRKAEIALNVTNLTDKKGWSSLSIGSATNSYSAYPIAPRQWFLTLTAAY
ncbi:TonB-dependent receptor [Sphingomonas nostoxanthinifaciens]|uniref:TonB-dependent receptor n=1 Tax=Sphingomonas nostoxanthinifaciens TaxID=2872652 RepID=UPI001CC1E11E|nr:TonB-dependent receptor plug domain-containing protein [Sphingomonas nostoxanthinifaciens]UAK23064.1 TonB-dependent receptor plug domain-containing protein [Sphingomonas nostoxanthinifaciens]